VNAWQGAASFRNRQVMRTLKRDEPIVVLLDIGIMLRGDPLERGPDLMTALAALFAEATP
jgi:hypothetical protein